MIRRLALLAAAVAVTGLVAWALPRVERPPTPFQVARDLIEAGRAAEAVYLFESAAWRGVAEYRAGRFRRALGEFFQEESVLTLYNMGNAYARLQEWEPAIAAYQRVLRLEPGHADARHNLALVTEAAALARRQAAESRRERRLGRWQDGLLSRPEEQAGRGETTSEGEGGQGQVRGASPAAAGRDSGGSRRQGAPGEKVASEQPGSAAARPDAPKSDKTPEAGRGASAVALAREAQQEAEILLRQVTDDPARVLGARLFHAHRARLAGKAP